MSLAEYARKRDFSRTGEPRGSARKATKRAALRFVIQKHDASRLHYDFRLELDGTLKSWAVPKGIPFAKGDKRLAVQVEDHPLEYASFEGVIPQGQYGGGTVMLWDEGTYKPLSDAPARDLAKGKLHVELSGSKLRGEWRLVRMAGEDGRQWLLIKSREDTKAVSKASDNRSVVSGRTMAEIARAADAVWHSKESSEEIRKLEFIEPMKARTTARPPRGEWLYEIKFDGYRVLAMKSKKSVQLYSRNEKDLTGRFPEIAAAIKKLRADTAILDGEIVALDENGRPSFQLLQDSAAGAAPIVCYLFDLLRLNEEDLCRQPVEERKRRLEALLRRTSDPLRFSATLEGETPKLLEHVKSLGLEGLMIKKAGSEYEPGRRSGAWLKLKCVNRQEFVIGGYTPPQGTRKYLGALLVGYYSGRKLLYAGKVGTGFSEKSCRDLHNLLKPLAVEKCPFSGLGPRSQKLISPADFNSALWVQPSLVCEVKFAEWTREAKLRQPVFLGLREDKNPKKVVREAPEA